MGYPNGDIKLSSNFELNSAIPLDSRDVVTNFSDLNSIEFKYAGLRTYVKNEDKYYKYNGSIWKEDGSASTSGEFIPLTGTTSGNIITGNLQVDNTNPIYFGSFTDTDNYSYLNIEQPFGVSMKNKFMGTETFIKVQNGFLTSSSSEIFLSATGTGNFFASNGSIGFQSNQGVGVSNSGSALFLLAPNGMIIPTKNNEDEYYNSGGVIFFNSTTQKYRGIVNDTLVDFITSADSVGSSTTAGNGLTLNVDTIELGGTLTKPSDIDINDNTFTISDSGSLLFDPYNTSIYDYYETLSINWGERELTNSEGDIIFNWKNSTVQTNITPIDDDDITNKLYVDNNISNIYNSLNTSISNLSNYVDENINKICPYSIIGNDGNTTYIQLGNTVSFIADVNTANNNITCQLTNTPVLGDVVYFRCGIPNSTPTNYTLNITSGYLDTLNQDEWILIRWNGTVWERIATNKFDNAFIKKDGATTTTATIPFELGINSKTDSLINGLTVGKGNGNVIYNTAFGDKALFFNTTGNLNTAIGGYSLFFNTTGNNNIAMGFSALIYNKTGNENVAIGANSLTNNDSGINNIGIGTRSLGANITGNFNIAIGTDTFQSLQSGNANVGIGWNSGAGNNGGNYNTYIGNNTATNGTSFVNSTALGANSLIDESNVVVLGDSFVTKVKTSGKLVSGTITYPNTDGTVNQVLATNGSGVLGWIDSGSNLNIYKTIFVDISNGNDTTALKYNTSKRYSTIKKALQDAVSGDTVYVFAGLYDEYNLPPLDGVTLYLAEGVTIQPTFNGGNVAIISEHNAIGGRDGSAMVFKIKGRGKLLNNGYSGPDSSAIVVSRNGSIWEVEADTVSSFEIWRGAGQITFKNTKFTREIDVYGGTPNVSPATASFYDCEFQNATMLRRAFGSYNMNLIFHRCRFIRTVTTVLANSYNGVNDGLDTFNFKDINYTGAGTGGFYEFRDCIFINLVGGNCLRIGVTDSQSSLIISNCSFYSYDHINNIQGSGLAIVIDGRSLPANNTNITYFLNNLYSNVNYSEINSGLITNSYLGSNWFTYNTLLKTPYNNELRRLNIYSW